MTKLWIGMSFWVTESVLFLFRILHRFWQLWDLPYVELCLVKQKCRRVILYLIRQCESPSFKSLVNPSSLQHWNYILWIFYPKNRRITFKLDLFGNTLRNFGSSMLFCFHFYLLNLRVIVEFLEEKTRFVLTKF